MQDSKFIIRAFSCKNPAANENYWWRTKEGDSSWETLEEATSAWNSSDHKHTPVIRMLLPVQPLSNFKYEEQDLYYITKLITLDITK